MTDPFAGAEPTLPPYASWGRRFAALVIDGFLLALPLFLPLVLFAAVAAGDPESEDQPDALFIAVLIGWLLTILLPFVYYTVLHGRSGQTVGKRALGIRVIGEDFQPIGYGRAFGRFLMAWVMWLACYVPGILDGLWPLWDDKNQALHDKVVNSIVVRVVSA